MDSASLELYTTLYEIILFAWGLLNNLLLIAVFILRRMGLDERMPLIKRLGHWYFGTGALALAVLVFSLVLGLPSSNLIFCGIFLAYLGLEALFDFILKIDFRSNWKLLTPYVILYMMANYGLCMMIWAQNVGRGIATTGLWAL